MRHPLLVTIFGGLFTAMGVAMAFVPDLTLIGLATTAFFGVTFVIGLCQLLGVRISPRVAGAIIIVFGASVVAICAMPFLQPSSTQTKVFWGLIGLAALVFFVGGGLLLLATGRGFRR